MTSYIELLFLVLLSHSQHVSILCVKICHLPAILSFFSWSYSVILNTFLYCVQLLLWPAILSSFSWSYSVILRRFYTVCPNMSLTSYIEFLFMVLLCHSKHVSILCVQLLLWPVILRSFSWSYSVILRRFYTVCPNMSLTSYIELLFMVLLSHSKTFLYCVSKYVTDQLYCAPFHGLTQSF